MSTISIVNKEGKESGNIEMPKDLFGKYVNEAIIHQAVVMYQASLRQGNASTKERADVSGGGKKPYRQKGTGRARAGSSRSPLWKGGGVTFGPHPRDFGYTLPKKIKKAALKEALHAKYKANALKVIDDLTEPLEKTKNFVEILKNIGLSGRILAVLDGSDSSLMRVTRNLSSVNVMRVQDINAYDIMHHQKILISKTAFNTLLDRIQK